MQIGKGKTAASNEKWQRELNRPFTKEEIMKVHNLLTKLAMTTVQKGRSIMDLVPGRHGFKSCYAIY